MNSVDAPVPLKGRKKRRPFADERWNGIKWTVLNQAEKLNPEQAGRAMKEIQAQLQLENAEPHWVFW